MAGMNNQQYDSAECLNFGVSENEVFPKWPLNWEE